MKADVNALFGVPFSRKRETEPSTRRQTHCQAGIVQLPLFLDANADEKRHTGLPHPHTLDVGGINNVDPTIGHRFIGYVCPTLGKETRLAVEGTSALYYPRFGRDPGTTFILRSMHQVEEPWASPRALPNRKRL